MTAPRLLISGLPLLRPDVGVGTHTLRLVRGLAKDGSLPFRVLLPCKESIDMTLLPPDVVEWIEGAPPAFLRHPFLRHLWWMDRIAAAAGRAPSGTVFHSPGPFWNFRSPPPLSVVTLHDCIYRHFPRYLGRLPVRGWLARATERYAARCRLVITDSECSRNDLRDLAGIPEKKIVVLPNWIEDRDHYAPEQAREAVPAVHLRYGLPPRFWLYLGGYDYRKNVETLIRAYAQTRVKNLELPPLVLAGKIPASTSPVHCAVHETLRTCGLKPGRDVFLPGLIAEADLPGLYAGAELFIYPSLYEGFGLPPVEAMAVGTPVLVADGSSLPEVVEAAANRFPPGDPDALAALLNRAAADPSAFRLPLPEAFREASAVRAYVATISALADLC